MINVQDIENILRSINKKYGDGSAGTLSSASGRVEAIPTGIASLDWAIGIGGIPKGRITEIFGHEASGKTTIALYACAMAQKLGLLVAYVDMEHALDPVWCEKCGIDLSTMIISQPDNGEQALDIAEEYVRSEKIGLVVVDSVASLVPQKELDGDAGDSVMGLQARLMSQAMRKLTGVIDRTNCAVIFTNQIRQKIGVMFGSPDTTPGGLALKFYAAVRIQASRRANITVKNEVIGNAIGIKIVKSKVGPPFRNTEFQIFSENGVDLLAESFRMGTQIGVIERRGGYYYFNESTIGRGETEAINWWKTNATEDNYKEITDKMLSWKPNMEKDVDVVELPVKEESEE